MDDIAVLVLDDSAYVRDTITSALCERGYKARPVKNAIELLHGLLDCDSIVLDSNLGVEGPTAEDVHTVARRLFPETPIKHEAIVNALGLNSSAIADGRYVAAVVRDVAPSLEIVVLTAFADDAAAYFNSLGITAITTKVADDDKIKASLLNFTGLIDELDGFLTKTKRPRRPARPEEAREPSASRAPTVTLGDFVRSLRSGISLRDVLVTELSKWGGDIKVRAEVLFFNHDSKYLEQIAQVGMADTLEAMRVRDGAGASLEGMGLCAYAATNNKSVLSPDVAFDRRYLAVRADDTTRSELVIPLALDGQVVGVLNLEADAPYTFDNTHLAYYESCSRILALLVEVETFRKEERFLNASIELLQGATTETELLATMLSAVVELVGPRCLGCVLVPVGGVSALSVVANQGLTAVEVGSRLDLRSLAARGASACFHATLD